MHATLALLAKGELPLGRPVLVSWAGKEEPSVPGSALPRCLLFLSRFAWSATPPPPAPSPAAVGGMLPAVLGLVFVGVALLSWNRVQHWRRRGGAGYQPTGNGRAGAPGDAQFNGEGHLGASLGHRAGPPAASSSPVQHV